MWAGWWSPGARRDAGAGGSRSCTTSAESPAARRTIALRTGRKLPRVLSAGEVQAILDACGRLRDRLLFAVLYDTGIFSAGHPLRRKPISMFAQLRG